MVIGEIRFGKATEVASSGVKVIFPTQTLPSNIYYKKYKHVTVNVNDTVAMKWTGNTYICEGVI
ncbi:hypothetical protein CS063_13785 [Sporanaerobium hydrogeniformans]|uniref:Uncharacterized protein n=1 Tax=Sporanaerobium hydrogeniformans TaxID=3072179 RepID=A0AC61D8Y5_9FIRM|nr:hypothetical protein [Sporanaerobium hydrogeniformans]PHV69784.1 hypothetical protein CS063_13785 [Sporanaerobium hydrogeniformans]